MNILYKSGAILFDTCLLMTSILLLSVNLSGQSPGGVKNYLLWEKDFDSADFITEGNELFNFHSYDYFDERKKASEIELAKLNKISLFMVLSNEKESNIGKIETGGTPITFEKNAVVSKKRIAYPEVGSKPIFLTYVESLKSQNTKQDVSIFEIGNKDNTDAYQGGIAEIIVYDRLVNKKQRDKIESYLSLKYGISLPITSSYFDANGTVIWDPKHHGSFVYNLTALGRDDESGLNQMQSKNQYSDLSLTFGLSKLEELNKDHKVQLQDDSYLFISDNGKPIEFIAKDGKSNIETIERTWKVSLSNQSLSEQSIVIKIDPLDIINFNPTKEIWIAISKDPENEINLDNAELIKLIETPDGKLSAPKLFFDADDSGFDGFSFVQIEKFSFDVDFSNCAYNSVDLEIECLGLSTNYDISLINEQQVFKKSNNKSLKTVFKSLPYGDYRVEVSNDEKLLYSDNLVLSGSSCNQIEEIALYPNPVLANHTFDLNIKNVDEKELTISIVSEGGLPIDIINIQSREGQFYYQGKIPSTGIYFIGIEGEEFRHSLEIVVVD